MSRKTQLPVSYGGGRLGLEEPPARKRPDPEASSESLHCHNHFDDLDAISTPSSIRRVFARVGKFCDAE